VRIRTLSISVLSAGLLLGGLTLTTARADDQPKEQSSTPGTNPSSPDGRRGFPMLERVRAAVDELKLSDDQKGKVDKMFEDAQSQIKKMREEGTGERQGMMKKTREIFEKLREDIGGVLTDDQKEQFKSKFEKLFQRGGAAGSGTAGAGAGEMVSRLKSALEKLNLSDDQKTKVHELFEETTKKAKDLHAQAENGGTDAREKLRDLMKDTHEKLSTILTDDQKQKLQESMQEGGGLGAKGQAPDKKPSE